MILANSSLLLILCTLLNTLATDMHGPNGQNVTIWWVTRCFVDIWWNFLRKCQNRQFFDGKCTNLVTLVETEFQCYQIAGLPDMNIFGQILAIFGFFSKKLGDNVPFLSGNSPNYDILAIWQKHVWLLHFQFTKLIFPKHICNIAFESYEIFWILKSIFHTKHIE